MVACRDDKKIGLTRAVKAAEVLHAGCVRKGTTGEHVDECQNMDCYSTQMGRGKETKRNENGLVDKIKYLPGSSYGVRRRSELARVVSQYVGIVYPLLGMDA